MKMNKFKAGMLHAALVTLALAPFTWTAGAQQSPQPSLHVSPDARAHARYTVKDLGVLTGGSFSLATAVNDAGLITGVSDWTGGTQHATLSWGGQLFDISKNAEPGINSGAFASNLWGQVLVLSEIPVTDPNQENFCAYGTGNICSAFLWQDGRLHGLAGLGGPNSTVSWINNRGQAVGIAETAKYDPNCYPGVSFTGTGPQVLDFEAVLWDLPSGRAHELPPLAGDTVGLTLGINDSGQVVGGSGSCANTFPPGPATAPHAVLWENGIPTNMGSLGGTVNTDLPGIANVGLAINNRGEVTGVSALPGNTTAHAFLWSKRLGHMVDVGTLSGDVHSAGLAINEEGDVVGPSFDEDGNPRAYLWHRGYGTPVDLNTLVQTDAPLYLLVAFSINDSGEIVGFGVDNNGDVHGFLATPTCGREGSSGQTDISEAGNRIEKPHVVLSDNARDLLRKYTRFGGFLDPRKNK
jgi:probable HAF family extracellular repeat protein